jgi:hypothetical protein
MFSSVHRITNKIDRLATGIYLYMLFQWAACRNYLKLFREKKAAVSTWLTRAAYLSSNHLIGSE